MMEHPPADSASGTEQDSTSCWRTSTGTLRVWAILLASLVIASVYLATVRTNFDFMDDGVTAHPRGVASFADFHSMVWHSTRSEFIQKGPYRPMAWYFWIAQQEYCAGNPLGWRVVRFLWTVLSVASFLWLLRELGFGAGVSLITAAIAMWNPYRAEVWLSPTYCEGIALPFAMAGLVCAYRAPRSERAWLWDLGAIAGAIAAVACKNVFLAVIPAQVFLRVCHPELSLLDGVKRFRWRALLLSSVLILPVVHFVLYRMTMNPERYDLAWNARQPLRLLNSFLGAMAKDFLGPAFVSALALIGWARFRGWAPEPTTEERVRFRAAFGAGLILFFFGLGVYVPMNGVAGRYTFPGVWGFDLWCALLWGRVGTLISGWQKVTYALLSCGLIICVIAIVGKQEKNHVRIAALWDALRCVEENAPTGAPVAWVGVHDRQKSEELETGEGIHFRWHLMGRGRRDLAWIDLAPGAALTPASAEPALVVSSSMSPPAGSQFAWKLVQEIRQPYWFGKKEVVCCVWQRSDTLLARKPTEGSLTGRRRD